MKPDGAPFWMSALSRWPIPSKLIAVNMVTAVVALALALAGFAIYEVYAYRESVRREMQVLAQMLSESSAPALAFDDRKAAEETLNILRHEPRIVAACIFDLAGNFFSGFRADRGCHGLEDAPEGTALDGTRMTLRQPVILGGEAIGSVALEHGLQDIWARHERYVGIALLVLAVSSLAALLISSALQKLISDPLLELAGVASAVSARHDFSLRAVKSGDDEIGVLVDRFNEMLAQLQDRDRALQCAHDELEDRVEQRTRELSAQVLERRRVEERLLAAKLAAEDSNRAKGAFLANMSHELRTPLNAIIGYSEMLEEDAGARGDVEAVSDLQKIRNAGAHLLALIQDILDLSKVEAGKMSVVLQDVAVEPVVEEAKATAEPLARQNRNRVEVIYEANGEVMRADPVKFRQSLFNLLSNACKFTEDGVITLEVEPREADMLWHVRDTGIGIDPGQQHKLFQSFSQVDSSATRRYQGTGLGLAISQRLFRLMGGEITVKSEPGRGAAFTIRIPLAARCGVVP